MEMRSPEVALGDLDSVKDASGPWSVADSLRWERKRERRESGPECKIGVARESTRPRVERVDGGGRHPLKVRVCVSASEIAPNKTALESSTVEDRRESPVT